MTEALPVIRSLSPLGATEDQPVRLDGCRFLVSLPSNAGRVIGLAHYTGRFLITAENGDLYEWDGGVEAMRAVGDQVK